MPRNTEFDQRVAAIEELVGRLETATDPAARAASQELVRAVMDLHGEAVERMLAAIRGSGAAAATILDRLARDELVASVLLLHDLHPQDLETRVRGALEKTRPYLKSHGGNVELVSVDAAGVVRLRLEGSCHGCPSSAVTLELAIKQAIVEAAPDVSAIEVEGKVEPAHPAVTPLVAIAPGPGRNGSEASDGWTDVPGLDLAAGTISRREICGREVLFCLVEGSTYAYEPRCPACDADAGRGTLDGRTLACPGCGQGYDLVRAGLAPDRPDLQLAPIPLLTRHGRTQVALPPPRVAAGLAPV